MTTRAPTQLDREAFRQDVVRTKGILEDATGRPVRGYRAPSYSIGEGNLWALDVLHEAGHVYSSSIYPIRHDLYGMPGAPRFAFRPRVDSILELPVTTVEFAGRTLPPAAGAISVCCPTARTAGHCVASTRATASPASSISTHGKSIRAAAHGGCLAAFAVPSLRQSRHDGDTAAAAGERVRMGPHGRGIRCPLRSRRARRRRRRLP